MRAAASWAPFLTAFATVIGLGALDGGYFPGDWGLAMLAFVLVAATAVLVADLPRPGSRELAFVAGLGGLAIWAALSAAWSPGATAPVLEAERGLLYLAAATAAVCLLSFRNAIPALLGGVVTGTVAVSLYALATRLYPGRVGGAYDPSSGYQLAEPVGYWNTLGLLTAMGILLAAGFAAHGRLAVRGRSRRCRSSCSSRPSTSRSAAARWRRSSSVWPSRSPSTRAGRGCSPPGSCSAPRLPSACSWRRATTRSLPPATRSRPRSARAARSRQILAPWRSSLQAPRWRCTSPSAAYGFPSAPERLFVAAVAAVVVLSAAGAVVSAGGPVDVAHRAADAFGERPAGEADLQRRLLSTSGNGRDEYWRVAWAMVEDEPVLGARRRKLRDPVVSGRSVAFHARDAHNLYLETLAELGPVGLVLLVATLALPLAALPAARRYRLRAGRRGAFGAYLVHAGVDWDWEMPVVTIPAIFCAASCSRSERPDESPWLTGRRRAATLVLLAPIAAVALVAHAGNGAAAASIAATEAGDPTLGLEEAKRAARWAPWSEEAWQLRGEAELELGELAAARRSLTEALERNRASWSIWFDLALASEGESATRALDRAEALNPLSPEVRDVRTKP